MVEPLKEGTDAYLGPGSRLAQTESGLVALGPPR